MPGRTSNRLHLRVDFVQGGRCVHNCIVTLAKLRIGSISYSKTAGHQLRRWQHSPKIFNLTVINSIIKSAE